MTNHWHEQIQRFVSGQASAAEAAALQEALTKEVELRALYLDYVNLDVALGAVAERATITEKATEKNTRSLRSTERPSPHYGRWLIAAVACAVLFTFAWLLRHRIPSQQTNPDVAAACASTQEAIKQLSVEPSSSFPAWASPTASMLDPHEF
jgi:anti-sigma factor RsiW